MFLRRLLSLWPLVFAGLLSVAGCAKTGPVVAGGKTAAHWVKALKDPDAKQRRTAARKLGNIGTADPAALPALLEALKDNEAEVRQEAILSLVKFGTAASDAAPVLREMKERDPEPQVRIYAEKALKKIEP
jgi:HEAT repeat protein